MAYVFLTWTDDPGLKERIREWARKHGQPVFNTPPPLLTIGVANKITAFPDLERYALGSKRFKDTNVPYLLANTRSATSFESSLIP